jgi:hypothetical protein
MCYLNLERGTGLEPATACLEGRSSTTELPPLEGQGAFAADPTPWPRPRRRPDPAPGDVGHAWAPTSL